MQINPKITQEYYIVFTGSKHNNWMVNRLKAPFQHVYAVKKSDGGALWVKIDPTSSATLITLHPTSDFPHIRNLIGKDDVVLNVKAIIGEKERWSFCVINCVEIIKSLLGIRAFWIWTPKQLHKYIKGGRNGQHI